MRMLLLQFSLCILVCSQQLLNPKSSTLEQGRILIINDLDSMMQNFQQNLTSITDSKRNDLKITFKNIQQLINDSCYEFFATQEIDTMAVLHDSEFVQVTAVKGQKDFIFNLLKQDPTNFYGSDNKQIDPWMNISEFTIFQIIASSFKVSPYRIYKEFPYPEQQYATIRTDLTFNQSDVNLSLPRPFQYLFNTDLLYEGDLEDEGSLDEFMEQTRYMVCIGQENQSQWNTTCEQETIIHPNGKILIECDCFNLSTAIALINDTEFLYFPEEKSKLPPEPIEYMQITSIPMLWIIICLTVTWGLFAAYGYNRDSRTLKRMQHTRLRGQLQSKDQAKLGSLNTLKNDRKSEPKFQKIIVKDVQQQAAEKKKQDDLINELKQDSGKNSFIIQFEKDELESKKKQKKKSIKYQDQVKDQQLQTEVLESAKRPELLHGHKKNQKSDTYKVQNQGAEAGEQDEYEDDEVDDEEEDGEDEEEVEDEDEDEVSKKESEGQQNEEEKKQENEKSQQHETIKKRASVSQNKALGKTPTIQLGDKPKQQEETDEKSIQQQQKILIQLSEP